MASSKLEQLSKTVQWTSSNSNKIMTKTCLSCPDSTLISQMKAVLLPQAKKKGLCSLLAYVFCEVEQYFASVLGFGSTKNYHVFASAVRMGCFGLWQVRTDINFVVAFVSRRYKRCWKKVYHSTHHHILSVNQKHLM